MIVAGAVWTDYSTLGYSHLLPAAKTIEVRGDRVIIKGGASFGCVDMEVGRGGGEREGAWCVGGWVGG